jgi:hypothetical protein
MKIAEMDSVDSMNATYAFRLVRELVDPVELTYSTSLGFYFR